MLRRLGNERLWQIQKISNGRTQTMRKINMSTSDRKWTRCRIDRRWNCYSPGRQCKKEDKTKFPRKVKEKKTDVNPAKLEQKSN
jgi:hypothetical protein